MTQASLNVPNLDRLISHMERLRPDQFDMGFVFRGPTGKDAWNGYVPDVSLCGTAACIVGGCAIVIGIEKGDPWDGNAAGGWLGLSKREQEDAFIPLDYTVPEKYPLSRALRMLRHLRAEFIRTGNVVIDWDAPEAVEAPRKPWSPPLVIGADRPLPSSLTSLLREADAVPAATTEA